MDVRGPAVAGGFYPGSEREVVDELRELFSHWEIDYDSLAKRKRKDCFGVVVPHAGYVYSGYVAARVFADLPKAERIILIGPNHTGLGPDFSVSKSDSWQTPLGTVRVDTTLAGKLADKSLCELDGMAHLREHSIEVQLPFLQSVLDKFAILPIAIKNYAPNDGFLDACKSVGAALAELVKEEKSKKTVFVASTDFTHYEPQTVAEEKDAIAMAQIEKLDSAGLFEAVSQNSISMCGYAGVAVVMEACRALGAKSAENVAYMTSAYASGDSSAVVGYGGMRIF